jgi:hypothetical protein
MQIFVTLTFTYEVTGLWKKKEKKKKKIFVLPFDKKGKLEDKAQGVLPFLYPMTAFSVKHL